jgi:catechol 2,3-dioxygenase
VSSALHIETRIGHVQLRVSDIARATAFYRDVLGFDVVAQMPLMSYLTAGDEDQHVVLDARRGRSRPPAGNHGRHYVAIRLPDEDALTDAFARLVAACHPIDGAKEDGDAISMHVRDPDGNGVRLWYGS